MPRLELIPCGPANQSTAATVGLVDGIHQAGASIKCSDLRAVIPLGTPNTYNTQFGVRTGFKYEWTDANNVVWRIHGHVADAKVPETQNAGAGPIVRIRKGNKLRAVEGGVIVWKTENQMSSRTQKNTVAETIAQFRNANFDRGADARRTQLADSSHIPLTGTKGFALDTGDDRPGLSLNRSYG